MFVQISSSIYVCLILRYVRQLYKKWDVSMSHCLHSLCFCSDLFLWINIKSHCVALPARLSVVFVMAISRTPRVLVRLSTCLPLRHGRSIASTWMPYPRDAVEGRSSSGHFLCVRRGPGDLASKISGEAAAQSSTFLTSQLQVWWPCTARSWSNSKIVSAILLRGMWHSLLQ